VGDAQPIRQCPYTLPEAMKEKVAAEVKGLLEAGLIRESSAGLIRESSSAWASPVVSICKPDGAVRLCVEYRKNNTVTCPDPFYMATLEEVVQDVGKSKDISRLNLTKGYYQIEVKECDKE